MVSDNSSLLLKLGIRCKIKFCERTRRITKWDQLIRWDYRKEFNEVLSEIIQTADGLKEFCEALCKLVKTELSRDISDNPSLFEKSKEFILPFFKKYNYLLLNHRNSKGSHQELKK